MAEAAGLYVVAGTQYRHQRDYATTFSMIKNGAIGNLISACCYYNIAGPPNVKREDGWSDMEFMIRNRGNWRWLTGDVIVNLLVHQLDILNWFFEKYPSQAIGYGGRHRRLSGDMWDFFSVDFTFDDKRRYQGMCRQMDGCSNNVGQIIFGTDGYTNCQNQIFDYDGNLTWEYEYPRDADGKPTDRVAVSAYDQEMIDLVTSIRTNNPVNEVYALASSTFTGIMGRESAYTGKVMTMDDMMNSNLRLGPKEYTLGPVDLEPDIPVPGSPPRI
jgi:predicted dehydrogenase